ncbi:hypothetical protein [Nitratifractor salsuginis]|uniref:Uncharacterized protein n=1 Tax=Nitratifractor salsuginis (strain DSM 16511 / JCM 12458 / E9I37-1) TaxID=749222 RepID=E6WXN7_NITSE|nr:hypothetical protein [Nitratifractor salsuginis]ADV46294.1 hypothetical protein Nitsa_1036 [Nitratifractor salsuginis DSM 16511]
MREKESVNSFEPRHLRQANQELRQLEHEIFAPTESRESSPKIEAKAPGFLRRWWRMLFGGA